MTEAKKALATKITGAMRYLDVTDMTSDSGQTFLQNHEDDKRPTHLLPLSLLAKPVRLLELMIETGFAGSSSEARGLVRSGAVRINNVLVVNESRIISEGDIGVGERLDMAIGKDGRALVQFT
ncbi:S4 domain-containing protein [Flexibacterium corallicola]|uniref:S4 domain-containing protein n=1 Tax=Flexibacterium corallicola TaxID=3037259 RepID=UPI00286F6F69|nr:S4 domain-containing protein [Pseudovibrio sp. M1P-2-3]